MLNNRSQTLNHIIIYLALAGLLALGLWLRLRFIQAVQLYPDEFVTLLAVRMIGEKGLPVMPSGLFYDHGLLFSYAGSLAALLGPARLAVRYTSLAFGLLALGLTFYLGRRWFSPGVGLVAAAGLMIAPTAIEWSGRARMYALLQLLVLVTLWLAYEGIVRRQARWRWLALLAYLGATLTHFVAVALAPPLVLAGLVLGWLHRHRPQAGGEGSDRQAPLLSRSPAAWPWTRQQACLEATVLLIILVVAFLVKRAGQPKGIEPLETANALAGLAQVFAIYSNFSLNLASGWQTLASFYLTLPAVIFGPFALIMVLAAGSEGWRAGQRSAVARLSFRSPFLLPSIYLTLILLLTTLEMFFASPDRRDDKYLFMLLPLLLLLGAQGMAVVVSVVSGHALRAASGSPLAPMSGPSPPFYQSSLTPSFQSCLLPLIISGLILTFSRAEVEALLANTGDNYDAAFAYVQSHWQAGDVILTGTPAAAALYLGRNDFYAVQRRGGYDYRILNVDGRAVDRWLASPTIPDTTVLHQVLAGHPAWLVLERWGLQREYYDLPFQQQLLAQTEPVEEAQAQGIFVLRSKAHPQPLASEPAQPLEASLADLVQLTGYTLEPAQPAPGDTLRLTLYWRALAPLPHNYTVFVHLRQPAGKTVAQADHRPLGDLYPTTLWPVGELIRESSNLALPPELSPGHYELWAGLYLLETGERLPVQHDRSGENAVRLGEVVVK